MSGNSHLLRSWAVKKRWEQLVDSLQDKENLPRKKEREKKKSRPSWEMERESLWCQLSTWVQHVWSSWTSHLHEPTHFLLCLCFIRVSDACSLKGSDENTGWEHNQALSAPSDLRDMHGVSLKRAFATGMLQWGQDPCPAALLCQMTTDWLKVV